MFHLFGLLYEVFKDGILDSHQIHLSQVIEVLNSLMITAILGLWWLNVITETCSGLEVSLEDPIGVILGQWNGALSLTHCLLKKIRYVHQ